MKTLLKLSALSLIAFSLMFTACSPKEELMGAESPLVAAQAGPCDLQPSGVTGPLSSVAYTMLVPLNNCYTEDASDLPAGGSLTNTLVTKQLDVYIPWAQCNNSYSYLNTNIKNMLVNAAHNGKPNQNYLIESYDLLVGGNWPYPNEWTLTVTYRKFTREHMHALSEK